MAFRDIFPLNRVKLYQGAFTQPSETWRIMIHTAERDSFFPNEDFKNNGISEEGGQLKISIFIKEVCKDFISYLP